ncbi:hypothetical protein [Ketogulonicigenium vulgare]|nr:hypothetical protein [Ketogulonicigenium vulgare]ADO42356.1 conserved hypothetical protein [Ketogulonicigenium vulgare Y25]AOZ54268.1 putative membrane protein [Ketogulonicigenium vulgare]
MFGLEFLELTLTLQVSLGAGYLAYAVAYAGYRKDHRAEDAIFITIAFSALAQLLFVVLEHAQFLPIISVPSVFLTTIAAGALWRKFGMSFWQTLMRWSGVHRDDGNLRIWPILVHGNHEINQCQVYLKDGRVLNLLNGPAYIGQPWDGLLLGDDGSVLMVVENEYMPNGSVIEHGANFDAEWGTSLTYVPASEVSRVIFTLKKS